uniref:Pyrrolo-quinoline quinone n=1 Tax=Solibacter usitatus (strain Ellin6076) TaxID=234267 RepID=Q01WU5_SOLUE
MYARAAAFLFAIRCLSAQPWASFANGPQHNALSPAKSQSLTQIRWHTPVDLQPQYEGSELLIHYGSPLVTALNTVIVPVKTGVDGNFRVEARTAADGALKWSLASDYVLPSHDWTPVFGPVLTPSGRLYYPGAGGTVYFRDLPDSSSGPQGQIAFYGMASFSANVIINTPLTADSAGNIYFGFLVTGPTPIPLSNGVARIDANGQGSWAPVAGAVSTNCAPALSRDRKLLYIAVNNMGSGSLVALDSATLTPVARVALKDPVSGSDSLLDDNASSSPTVGPDGDVYYGVLENPVGENHLRGWLLHFDSLLSQSKLPGAFGWDITASVVPSSMVPSYSGQSAYLLMTKYNDYAEAGGAGLNRLAILDPNTAGVDPVTGTAVMREVLTVAGVTPDGPAPSVKEWCINSAVVDPATHSIVAGNEDGKLYRWDLASNTLSQTLVLTPGLGEAYTPTLVGPDGMVYAINNATLFAVGDTAPTVSTSPDSLAFSYQVGQASPAAQTLHVMSSPAGLPVSVTATCSWLVPSPAVGVTPFDSVISLNLAGLGPGTYACSLTVMGPSGAQARVRIR